jgi:hypothetical protein
VGFVVASFVLVGFVVVVGASEVVGASLGGRVSCAASICKLNAATSVSPKINFIVSIDRINVKIIMILTKCVLIES